MPTSDNFTGINDTNILAAQQDSDSRLNDLMQNNPKAFVDPNNIQQPEAPKGLYGTVNPGDNINLDKTSYAYNANDYNSQMAHLSKQYPGSSGLPDILLPQSETNRYTGNDFGFKLDRDNESFYEKQQGFWKTLGNVGANLIGKTVAYAAQNAGFVLGAPLAPFDISNMTDNFLVRAGDWLKDKTAEDFPIYKSDKYTQGNIWQKLGTIGWWADDAIDRVALTAAMFLPGFAESKGLGLFGTVADEAGNLRATGLVTKAIQALSENPQGYNQLGKTFLSKLYNAAANGVADTGVQPALRAYAQNLSRGELFAWNVIGQSGLNAKETQEAIMKATGDKDKAAEGAMKSFWETVPLALAGSLVEIPQMFSTKNTTKSILNKIFDPETGEDIALKAPSMGKTLIKSILTGFEHGQNESMQVAVSRYNEESAEGKEKRGTIPGIVGDFLGNIHDPNGQNNIALGTIQGILMTLGGKGWDKFVSHQTENENAQAAALFGMINQAKLARRLYNEDFNQRDENGKIVIGEDGKPVKDQQKMADAGLSLIGIQNDIENKKKALEIGNYTAASLVDHKLLAEFAHNFFGDANGMEHLSNILKLEAKANENNADRVNDIDEHGNEITPQVQLQANLQTVSELRKAYNAIEQRHAGFLNLDVDRKDKEEVRQGQNFIEGLKFRQYMEASNQIFLNKQIDKNTREISSLGVDNTFEAITHFKDPSNPLEERFNDLHDMNDQLNEILNQSKENYKVLVNKKLQKDAFNLKKEFDKKIKEKEEKQTKDKEVEQTTPVQQPITVNNPAPSNQTQAPAPAQQTAPVQEEAQTTPQISKAQALLDKRTEDLKNSSGKLEEMQAINAKYIQDSIALANEGKEVVPTKSKEETDKKAASIKNLVPSTNTIDKNELEKLSNLVNQEVKVGNITPEDESNLINILNSKKVIGTLLNTEEDEEIETPETKQEEVEKENEDKPKEPTVEEIEEGTPDQQLETDVFPPQQYDPSTVDVDTGKLDNDILSALAFRSSNKTVTQEENTDTRGNYNSTLDEDPYKQFIQGYLRYLNQNGLPVGGVHGKVIKDNKSIPHNEDTAFGILTKGYGSVLVITDMDRNILHFDENYIGTPDAREGAKPIAFSFTSQYWDELKNVRAAVGEERTGISTENFLKMYEVEKEQQQLARELNDQGKDVNIEIAGISKGVIRKSSVPLKASDVITEQMGATLTIPSSTERFDPENPDATKYVTYGSRALINGGLYAETVDNKTGLISYTRLIPNLISDIPDLLENIKSLLNHTYDNRNEAIIVREHLKDLLFLGKPKRPNLTITEVEDGSEFNIRLLQDNELIDPEATLEFVTQQRLNISRSNIENDSYNDIIIKGKGITLNTKSDYKNYILQNSTTVDLPIQTSEGAKFIALNTYAIFNFLDSVDTMKARLKQEEPKGNEPTPEEYKDFTKNLTPIFRHGENIEDITDKNSGDNSVKLNEQGRKDAKEVGAIMKSMDITKIISSPILRTVETAKEAAKVAGIKKIEVNDLFKTWDIGDFTSIPDDQFDERWFVLHPDEEIKDGKALGETFNVFRKRMEDAYKFIRDNTDDKTAIVAHSRNIKMFDAIKENNGFWNDNAAERYLNASGDANFTSIKREEEELAKDNSSLTKEPLKRLTRVKTKSAEELAREQDEADRQKLKGQNKPTYSITEVSKTPQFFIRPSEDKDVYEIVGTHDNKVTWQIKGEKEAKSFLDRENKARGLTEFEVRDGSGKVVNTTSLRKYAEEFVKHAIENDAKKGLTAKTDTRENRPLLRQSEVNEVNQIFGEKVAQRVNDIFNSKGARAIWTTSGIKLLRDARQGDGYHEAWHHFSQLYLTQEEKRSLYDEARKKNLNFTDREGRKLNSKTASDIDLEEFIADDFRDYVESDGKSRLVERPYRNNIFRKILDFLKKFFFGDINISKLYDDLYKGNLNGYHPSINNAMWGKLNSKAVNSKGDEIVDNQKAARYRDIVDYLMGEQLLAAKTSVESLRKNRKLAEAIYLNIYNELVDKYYNPMLDKFDAGKEINQEVAEDLNSILTNWEGFVNYHRTASKLYLNIQHELAVDVPENPEDTKVDTDLGSDDFEIKEEDEETFGPDEVEKDTIQSDKLYDVAGNEQSSIQAASIQTRGLIRMLPAIDYDNGKFTVQLDEDGFPRLNDYARTWNNIAYELSNLDSYDEMYQKLNSPKTLKKIPEVSVLLKHLPNPNKEHTPAEINTIAAFRTDFNRAYIGIYSGIMYPDGGYYLNEETRRNSEQVRRVWTANFYNKTDKDPDIVAGHILLDPETGKYYLNPGRVLTYNPSNNAGKEQLLNLIGFSFSDDAKRDKFYSTGFTQYLSDIQTNINLRHQNGQKIYNPIFDLRNDLKDKDNKDVILARGLSRMLEGIVEFQARYAADVPSLSYQTAEGEMIYGLSLNHTLSIVSNKLNKAKSYDDIKNDPAMQHLNYLNNPYVTGSLFLNLMFGLDSGKRIKYADGSVRKIIVGNYNGFKQRDTDGKTVGFSTTNLNVRQKAIFDINSLLTRGVVEVMRTESSKTAYFIKLNFYVKDHKGDVSKMYLPIGFSDLPEGFQSPALMNRMIDGYLYDELNRIKNADNIQVYKNDPKLLQSAKGFNLFRSILTEEGKNAEGLKDSIKADLEKMKPEDVTEKYRERIENAINRFFQGELQSFKEGLSEENITAEDIASNLQTKSFDQQLRTFLANDFILNVEYTKLFNGDTIYQAHYKDYFKRSKGDISTGKVPMTDDLFARHMKSIEHNTFGAFVQSSIANDYKTFRTLNFKDDTRDSKYLEIYKKDLLASGVKPDVIEQWLQKYKDMKIADGQGYVTLDFYRQFLKSINNWSDAQEAGYQVELTKYRLANKGFNPEYTNEMQQHDREFLRNNPQNYSYYPPLKIQYNGPIKAIGTFAPVMDKFSVVPLIPSILQNTPLEQIHNEMLKSGIGYAKYVSGTKKYMHPPIEIYGKDGFSGLDLSKHEPAVHFLDYLKEQINTNPKTKSESIFGSQIRKLIEANIFSNGTATDVDMDRHARYKSYLKGIVELGKKELFSEIGLSESEGKIRIGDMEKFISTIQSQAELRELNDNIKDYIQYDKDTKKLRYALETSLNRKPIQDLLMGIVDRRLRVQKLSGDQLIQVSSSGYQPNDFKYTNATDEEIKKYGTNGLRFYHLEYDENGKPTHTVAAQVKVGLNTNGFDRLLRRTHPDGKRIGTLERLNTLLKDDNWRKENKKYITIIGYRIPTQGFNSMEHLEIAEFLPPHVGSSIIVPAEMVAKSGSDFDIDKLSIFRPSFDENGEIIDGESREGYSNKIINLFSEILSDARIFKQLIRPNDTDLVKPETNEVAVSIGKRTASDIKDPRPYSGTQIYRYKNNLRKFETLLSAKKLLSIFAVNNTFSTVMQQAGTLMNMSYGLERGVNRNVRLFLLSPKERQKVMDKGQLMLGSKYSVDGNFKQDFYSQLINATVDAASDDFFGYVNMSYENVNVLCHLLNQGVPFDRAIWFLNQPVLLRYYSDMRKRPRGVSRNSIKASILGELTGENYFFESETGKVLLDSKLYNNDVNKILDDPKYANAYFSKDTLKKYTVKNRDVDGFLANPINKTLNATIFAYFISLQEQAQLFRDLQRVSNYDTTKVGSPTTAYNLFAVGEQIKANKLFDQNEIAKISDRSVIGAFDNKRLIALIGATLMPVAFNPNFMSKSTRIIRDNTQYATRAAQKKFINNYETQWIEYVVKSLGKIGDYSIPQYSRYLQEGAGSLPRRFNELVAKFPELKNDYALVNKLRPNFPNQPTIKKSNIEVYRLFENTTDDQNRYIAEFRNLINIDSKKYTSAQNLEIQKFFRDLAILGFIQSGFNKSNISFQDIVPYEQLADIFKTTLQNFNKYIKPNEEALKKYILEYQSQFTLNQKSDKQPWRGRNYYLSDNVNKIITPKVKEDKAKQEKEKIDQVNKQAEPEAFENKVTPPQKIEEVKNTPKEKDENLRKISDYVIKNWNTLNIGDSFTINNVKFQVWDGDTADAKLYGVSEDYFGDVDAIAIRNLNTGQIAYIDDNGLFIRNQLGNAFVGAKTQQELDNQNQKQLLLPEVKTERQYWPGYEIQDSAPEIIKALGKAGFKHAMENLRNPRYGQEFGYVDLPKNYTSEDILEASNANLTIHNFEEAIKLYNEIKSKFPDMLDHVFFDIDKGEEISLEEMASALSKDYLDDPNNEDHSLEIDGLHDLLREYSRGEIPEEFINVAEAKLSEYGLLRFAGYNPNQLRIPFKGVDAEEYNKQINKVLNDKNQC